MNKNILCGYVTRDPEVRCGNNDTTIAHFTLAVQEYFEEEANFITCVAFNKQAEFIEKYVRRGDKFLVEGRIHAYKYEDKNGDTKYATEVIVNSCELAQLINSEYNDSRDKRNGKSNSKSNSKSNKR